MTEPLIHREDDRRGACFYSTSSWFSESTYQTKVSLVFRVGVQRVCLIASMKDQRLHLEMTAEIDPHLPAPLIDAGRDLSQACSAHRVLAFCETRAEVLDRCDTFAEGVFRRAAADPVERIVLASQLALILSSYVAHVHPLLWEADQYGAAVIHCETAPYSEFFEQLESFQPWWSETVARTEQLSA